MIKNSIIGFIAFFIMSVLSVTQASDSYSLKKVNSAKVGRKVAKLIYQNQNASGALEVKRSNLTIRPMGRYQLYKYNNVLVALKNASNKQVNVSAELGRQINKAIGLSHRIVIVVTCECAQGFGSCSMKYAENGDPLYCDGSCGDSCNTIIDVYGNKGISTTIGSCNEFI